MTLYAVSDLHIQGPEDPLCRSLIELLRERAQAADHVVLVGDVFDLFVGNNPIFLNRYRELIAALKSAGERGVRIDYLEGNHDFLIKRAFASVPNLRVHPGDLTLELEGKRFYFAHGDRVDQTDYGYRLLRVFFRSPITRAFVRFAPGKWVDGFGKHSADRSRKATPRLPSELPIERRERLRTLYRSYAAERLAEGFDFVVMGHCHDLDEMSFQIGGRTGQYVNVGFPRLHGSLLSWSPGEDRIHREKLPES